MVNLLVLVLMLSIARSQAPLTSCFHNQKFQLVSSGPYFLPQAGGYAYNISWTETQANITSYSFTLVGFFNTGMYDQQAFNASLVNVGPAGGTFIFDPQSMSSIVNIQFSFILVGTCSGYLQLQYIEFVPIQFNVTAGLRVENSSVYNVILPRPFTADLTNYKAQAFISAFHLTEINGDFDLKVEPNLIIPSTTVHKVTFYSQASKRNRYQRLWFTYLLIYLPLFQEQINYYFNKYDFDSLGWTGAEAITPNFGIPQAFYTNFTAKCLISLSLLSTYKGGRETEINFADLGTNIMPSITHIAHQYVYYAAYQIFCIQYCEPGTAIDKSFSTSTCLRCNDTVPFCSKCAYGNVNATFNVFTVNVTNSTTAVNRTLYCKKCQTNYYLVAAVNTCYDICPMGTYANNATGTCSYCNSVCKTCVDNLNCLVCKIGWPVDGGCTTIDGCIRALSPIICSKCSDNMNFVLSGASCICAANYYLVSHLCVSVFGCAGAVVSGNSTACILCNSFIGLIMDNGLCRCKDGYYFGTTHCLEICGDGKLYQYQCDDGNTVNGDGCSSACKVQADYQCSGGSTKRPSKCVYLKNDINLTVIDIQKADLYNKGIFTFHIAPETGNMGLLDFGSAVQFQCNQSVSIEGISYSNSQMVITVQYFQNLQGFLASIVLTLDNNYYAQPNARVTFNMTSNGNKLIRTSNLVFIKSMSIILSIMALIVFALSMFVHKMIGVELLISFQIVYLVHLVNNQYTEQYALLKYLSYTSWNFLGISEGSTNVATASSNEPFDSSSQNFALKMMISLAFALFAAIITVLAVKTIKTLKDPALSIKPFSRIMLLLYNQILFPITIAFSFVFLVIINTLRLEKETNIPYLIRYLQSTFMIFLSLLFFFEWKALLISDTKDPYVGVDKCQKGYIAFFITIFFLSTMTISFSCYHPQFDATVPVLVLEISLLLWLIISRPYIGTIHNAGVIINLFPSIAFLAWNFLRERLGLFENQQIEFLLVFVLLIIFLVSIILSIIRIIYQIWLMKQAEKAAIIIKLEKQMSRKKRKEEILRLIERQQMDVDKAGLEAPYLQSLRRAKYVEPQKERISPLNIKMLSDKFDRKKSPMNIKKIKNRLGQSDQKASRKKLLHLV